MWGSLSKVADFPDCPQDGWLIYGNGGVGPDGTVYISLHRCGHLAVAVSADEGDTWRVTDVPGTTLLPFIGLYQMVTRANALLTEPLALDAAGNVYMVWPDAAGLLQYAVSKDKAETWTSAAGTSRHWIISRAPSVGSCIAEPARTGYANPPPWPYRLVQSLCSPPALAAR